VYLAEHGYLGQYCIDIQVEQGYEIGRPSLLYLAAEKKEGEAKVSVGGKAQMVAKGTFL
jgi:trans-2,3-dihydro-3-hydroxyanthranilate isomerase